MATNDEIIEKYRELVISKDDGDKVEAIVNWNREFALNEARADEREKVLNEFEHWLNQETILNHNRRLKSGSYDLMNSYKSGFREAISNLRQDIAEYRQALKNKKEATK